MSGDGAKLESLLTRYAAAQTLAQLVACARDYEVAGAPRSPSWPHVRLALTGNYATQLLARGFPVALAARGLAAEIHESRYNQWRAELLDAASPLHGFAPTHVILALTSIEFAYGPLRSPEAVVESVTAAVQAALKTGDVRILVMLPEPLTDEISDNSAAYAWRRTVNDGLHAALSAPRVTLIEYEVFAERPEMMLNLADFAAAEIHWEPKSSSLARILDRLNLSAAGVVFLDDNPVERAEVQQRFPDIAVPDLPDDPAQRVAMLERTGLFDHRLATRESRDRNRMYA